MLIGTGQSAWGPMSCQLEPAATNGVLVGSSCDDDKPDVPGCIWVVVPAWVLLAGQLGAPRPVEDPGD